MQSSCRASEGSRVFIGAEVERHCFVRDQDQAGPIPDQRRAMALSQEVWCGAAGHPGLRQGEVLSELPAPLPPPLRAGLEEVGLSQTQLG